MQCPQCRTSNADLAKFCSACGTPLRFRCSTCQAEVPAGVLLCEECGAPLAPAAAPEPLVAATGSGRRQLTVMFCDLVGSTELSARMDPEDLLDIIAAYQRCVVQVVQGFGGFVARFIGDGALVYFGYPESHEDDPERAVRAGLAVVEALAGLQLAGGYTPRVRFGIATGVVVVAESLGPGEIYAAAGETPNLAARVQSASDPGAVWIAASTRQLLGGLFDVRELGAFRFKGFAEPVEVYEVLRPSRVRGRFGALRAADLTPLVGRIVELEQLDGLWGRALAGKGQAVVICGEAGIGKSRLVSALEERIAADDHVRLRYFCSAYHTNSALYPVAQFLEYAAGLRPEDTPAQTREKLARLMRRASPDECDLIAEFIATSTQPQGPDSAPSRRRKEAALAAMLAEVERIAARKPVFILIEDMHWADPTTLELTELLIDRISQLPVLLVVTFRTEFGINRTGRNKATQITLNRLGREQSATLVTHVAGTRDLPGDLIDVIVQRTDGVPLYADR